MTVRPGSLLVLSALQAVQDASREGVITRKILTIEGANTNVAFYDEQDVLHG